MAKADHEPFHEQFDIAAFEAWLARWLDARQLHPKLDAPVREGLLGGGKRFRAVLVFASGTALQAQLKQSRLWPVAGAVEMVHAYSLIHDDLPAMDDAALRRGRPTVHKRFGEALAILAGDALLTDAFSMLVEVEASPAAVVEVLRRLADAAGGPGMVGGQTGDLQDLPDATSAKQVRAIHALKTGALIEWSLLAPLRLFGASAAEEVAMQKFAEHLGILYQVRDDLLDLDPNAARDKDRDADAAKSTYARLLGVDGARAAAEQELAACLEAAASLPRNHRDRFEQLARWTAGRHQ